MKNEANIEVVITTIENKYLSELRTIQSNTKLNKDLKKVIEREKFDAMISELEYWKNTLELSEKNRNTITNAIIAMKRLKTARMENYAKTPKEQAQLGE